MSFYVGMVVQGGVHLSLDVLPNQTSTKTSQGGDTRGEGPARYGCGRALDHVLEGVANLINALRELHFLVDCPIQVQSRAELV